MTEDSLWGTTNICSGAFIFSNDLLWFHEKTNIFKFADKNTLYSCKQSLNGVTENLPYDLKIVF